MLAALPGIREVGHEVGLRGQSGVGFPDGHRLVQAPPVEERAHGPQEVGVEREYLVVHWEPVERAAFVLDVAVKRHVRHVNELGHVRTSRWSIELDQVSGRLTTPLSREAKPTALTRPTNHLRQIRHRAGNVLRLPPLSPYRPCPHLDIPRGKYRSRLGAAPISQLHATALNGSQPHPTAPASCRSAAYSLVRVVPTRPFTPERSLVRSQYRPPKCPQFKARLPRKEVTGFLAATD